MATDDKQREERLAAALRENLRRRKAQARSLDAKPDHSCERQEGGKSHGEDKI